MYIVEVNCWFLQNTLICTIVKILFKMKSYCDVSLLGVFLGMLFHGIKRVLYEYARLRGIVVSVKYFGLFDDENHIQDEIIALIYLQWG